MKQEEYNIQVKLVKDLILLRRNGDIVDYYAVINEASYDNGRAVKQGRMSGTSDLVILFIDHTLYLELKKDRPILKSGRISKVDWQKDDQKWFERKINKTTHNSYEITYGYDESKEIVDKYLDLYGGNKDES